MKKNLLLFFLLTFIGYACDSSEDTAEASFTIEISGETILLHLIWGRISIQKRFPLNRMPLGK